MALKFILHLNLNLPVCRFIKTFTTMAKMREVVSVHIGQAGCQIGNACWELCMQVFVVILSKTQVF